jgi:hypothetical protein
VRYTPLRLLELETVSAFGARRLELTDLIARVGVVAQRLIAMREPLRHVECALIVFVQLDLNMLQIGRAFRAQVDNDIEDRTARAADKLGFRPRAGIGNASRAQCLADVVRDIGLGDDRLEAMGFEFLLAKASRKEATRVISSLQINHKGTLEFWSQ